MIILIKQNKLYLFYKLVSLVAFARAFNLATLIKLLHWYQNFQIGLDYTFNSIKTLGKFNFKLLTQLTICLNTVTHNPRGLIAPKARHDEVPGGEGKYNYHSSQRREASYVRAFGKKLSKVPLFFGIIWVLTCYRF